eukprot:4398502-Pyramimonas_sp.AAC.1
MGGIVGGRGARAAVSYAGGAPSEGPRGLGGHRVSLVRPLSGLKGRGSWQTGVSQSAGSCRALQNQGCTDPGQPAGSY